MLDRLEKKVKQKANAKKAKDLQRYFKTGKGEYGEGDKFLGIVVGDAREIAREFKNLGLEDIKKLLNDKVHEKRLIALLILIEQYNKAKNYEEKEKIFEFYLEAVNNNKVNNWDLVDLSAPNIVGNFLLDNDRGILYDFAVSSNLWKKRVAIISCFSFIRKDDFNDALQICELLFKDKHDLIHKAVGWVLREIGKKNQDVLEDFLRTNYHEIPRTTLRYAIEKFDEGKRQRFLRGNF